MKILTLLFALAAFASPVLAQPLQWTLVRNRMSDQRWSPSACVLKDGYTAVIAGGFSFATGRCVSSINVYDEYANRFERSKVHLNTPRDFAQANLLSDGKVLISGGFNDRTASLNTAEIYDPVTDTCRSANGQMNQHRELFQAVNLEDGTILLVGGLDLYAGGTVNTAEIYHPDTEQFTPTAGNLSQDRFGEAACRLLDGRVLVVGGTHWSLRTKQSGVLDSAEIYDPASETFHTAKGHLAVGRDRPTATLLPGGTVLIYGGQAAGGASVTTAEIFDPATEQFTTVAAPPQIPRMAHSAVFVDPTNVVVTGGWDADAKATTPTAVLYSTLTGQFSPLPDLPFASHDNAELVFSDDKVLVAGGKSVVGNKPGSVDQGALLSLAP